MRNLPLRALLASILVGGLGLPLLASSPIGFLENRDQLDGQVAYYSPGPVPLFVTRDAIVFDLRSREGIEEGRRRGSALWLRFAAPSSRAWLEARDVRATRVHVLKGSGNSGPLSTFGEIVYHELWPGIDLTLRLESDRLLYELRVQPGADPARAKFLYEGSERVRRGADGSTLLETPFGELRQLPAGEAAGGAFVVSAASPSAPDPYEVDAVEGTTAVDGPPVMQLAWSTYLSGDTWFEITTPHGIAVDGSGAVVVAGRTSDPAFPASPGAYDVDYDNNYDGFVAKLLPDGSDLVWATFLGSSSDDRILNLALDGGGNPVVAGSTRSTGFPTTAGAYDTVHNGGKDGFVAKLLADGSALVFSTFLGGVGSDEVLRVSVDAAGRPVVTGGSDSGDFPTTTGAFQTTSAGGSEAFVTKLLADGSGLEWSSLIGGSGNETARALRLGSDGRVAVAGETTSVTDLPTTAGAFSTALGGGGKDSFVSVLSSDGSTLLGGSYLGASGLDVGYGLDLGANDEPVIAGLTGSANFPTTGGAFDSGHNGGLDVFATRMTADLSALVWSTFIGGPNNEVAFDLELDSVERPMLGGFTCSPSFPVTANAYDSTYDGDGSNPKCEGFLTTFEELGDRLAFSTFLGTPEEEYVYNITVGAGNVPYIAGETLSTDGFPTTPDAYDRDGGAFSYDTFVSKVVYPTVCVQVFGETGPRIHVVFALSGECPPPPGGTLDPADRLDVIRGDLKALAITDIGDVVPIACEDDRDVYQVEPCPAPGEGYFFLVRYSPAGSYTDGAGATLQGSRIPLSEDCP